MDIDDLHNEVLRAFNDSACRARPAARGASGFSPPADAFYEEEPRQIVVRFELPGVERDDISLLVDRRELVVRGERRFPAGEGASTSRSSWTTARSSGACASRSTSTPTSPRPPTRPASWRCASRWPSARARGRSESTAEDGRMSARGRRDRGGGSRAGDPGHAAGAAAARHGRLPGHDDPADHRPGAQHQAHRRRAGQQPPAGDGDQQERRAGDAGPADLFDGRHRRPGAQDGQAARRHHAHPRAGPAAGAHRPAT